MKKISILLMGLLLVMTAAQPASAANSRSCRGRKATIVGTDGRDIVAATGNRDVIVTLGGNDTVSGIEKLDLVCSGSGDDTISGAAGFVRAGSGADTVRTDNGRQGGGPGPDDLEIYFGNASGGAGNDRVESVHGSVRGGGGDDVLVGGAVVDGGSGDDVMRATEGCGPVLIPGPGDDFVRGGYGSCLEEFNSWSVLDLRTAPRDMRVNLATGTATGWGHDRLEDITRVTGTNYDDVLVAGVSGLHTLYGAGGDDRLEGGPGTDYLIGDDPYGPDDHLGRPGDDIVLGRGGDDSISTQAGDDRLIGGSGDDRLAGAYGSDLIDGGAGKDRVSFFSFHPGQRGVTVNLASGTATGRGRDELRGLESVEGTPYDDLLIGDDADNTFEPDFGDDQVRGHGGDDLMLDSDISFGSPSGDDHYDGGLGVDTLSWVYADDPITADLLAGTASGSGNETLIALEILIGSSKPDRFEGDDGDNRLVGGAGDDHLDGRAGVDVLDGGGGTDVCVNGEQMQDCP